MVLLTEQIIRGKTRLDRLDEVKNLNLWGQDLSDVSILSMMPNVEVLSLSVNHIPSLRDFRHCTKLQELYLRKNYIADISDIRYLAGLHDLRVLWLCDNPCADHPLYRQIVARMLPSVEKLDNQEITPQDREVAMRNPDLDQFVGGRAPSPPPQSAAPSPQLNRLPSGPQLEQTPSASRPMAVGGGPPSPPLPPPIPPNYIPPPTPAEPSFGRMPSDRYAAASPPRQTWDRQPSARQSGGALNGGMPADGGGPRRKKNILYAVMALVGELDEDDLFYVKREVEERLGALGR
uniref:U2A'/phosphoprotein 32 family A C-terminal domain-containing protein n=1 Tax=Dunaliella tertiolecta TaxID=3047 RepID=A0A7S3VHB5_DUNTE|mmetsp:Transcript_18537/g.52066  ORF Transcript_18537/g.52066 Transcript_18537/m.52066 type:complete len:291 (+) Transcript_18537:40-912(+)